MSPPGKHGWGPSGDPAPASPRPDSLGRTTQKQILSQLSNSEGPRSQTDAPWSACKRERRQWLCSDPEVRSGPVTREPLAFISDRRPQRESLLKRVAPILWPSLYLSAGDSLRPVRLPSGPVRFVRMRLPLGVRGLRGAVLGVPTVFKLRLICRCPVAGRSPV